MLCLFSLLHLFCFNRQPQKKGITAQTKKIQLKPVKDASFVDLTPSAPLMTNVVSIVEGIPIPVGPPTAKILVAIKLSTPMGCFDI